MSLRSKRPSRRTARRSSASSRSRSVAKKGGKARKRSASESKTGSSSRKRAAKVRSAATAKAARRVSTQTARKPSARGAKKTARRTPAKAAPKATTRRAKKTVLRAVAAKAAPKATTRRAKKTVLRAVAAKATTRRAKKTVLRAVAAKATTRRAKKTVLRAVATKAAPKASAKRTKKTSSRVARAKVKGAIKARVLTGKAPAKTRAVRGKTVSRLRAEPVAKANRRSVEKRTIRRKTTSASVGRGAAGRKALGRKTVPLRGRKPASSAQRAKSVRPVPSRRPLPGKPSLKPAAAPKANKLRSIKPPVGLPARKSLPATPVEEPVPPSEARALPVGVRRGRLVPRSEAGAPLVGEDHARDFERVARLIADAGLDTDLQGARGYLEPWLSGGDVLALVTPDCDVLGTVVATATALRKRILVVTGGRAASSSCTRKLRQHGLSVTEWPDSEEQQSELRLSLEQGQRPVVFVPVDAVDPVDGLPVLEHIQWDGVVLDEVQRTSELARDFDPLFDRLAQVSPCLGRPPTLALVRAAPPSVRSDLPHRLGLRTPIRIDRAPMHESVTLKVVATEVKQRATALLEQLEANPLRPALVVCSNPPEVDEVLNRLQAAQVASHRLDVGTTASSDDPTEDSIAVVQADRLGRAHIRPRLLVHYRSPASLEQYCRDLSCLDHARGDAQSIVFSTPDDEAHLKTQLDRARPKPEEIVAFCVALERHASTDQTALVDTLCVTAGFNRARVEPLLRLLTNSGWIQTEGDFIRILRERASLPERARFLAARVRTARERDVQRMRSMAAYVLSKNCRQESIRRHFGTTMSRPCGKCDGCRNHPRHAATGQAPESPGSPANQTDAHAPRPVNVEHSMPTPIPASSSETRRAEVLGILPFRSHRKLP